MFECLILGDSIAKGISQVRPECIAYVQNGINSKDFNNKFIKQVKPAKTVIISLGSNDFRNLNTEIELLALRSFINSNDVIWIVPANKADKAKIVTQIAKEYEDTIFVIPEISKDGVHPTTKGYKKLADLTK